MTLLGTMEFSQTLFTEDSLGLHIIRSRSLGPLTNGLVRGQAAISRLNGLTLDSQSSIHFSPFLNSFALGCYISLEVLRTQRCFPMLLSLKQFSVRCSLATAPLFSLTLLLLASFLLSPSLPLSLSVILAPDTA